MVGESLVIPPGTGLSEELKLLWEPPQIPLILGETSEGYVSLTDCHVRRGKGQRTNTAGPEILTVHQILNGVALSGVDEEVFSRVISSLEGLSAWYGMEAVEVNRTGRVVSFVDDFPNLEARWGDYTITISVDTTVQVRARAAHTETTAVQQAALSIEASSPRSFTELSRVSWTVRRLLSLAAARELAPLSETLVWYDDRPSEEGQESPGPMPETVFLLHQPITVAEPDRDTSKEKWLFRQQVSFSELIPRWFEMMEKLDVTINLLVRNWGINDQMIEGGINRLSAAADALSNTVLVAKPKFDADDWDAFKEAVLTQIDLASVDPAMLVELKERFPSVGVGYKTRVQALAERLGEEAAGALVGDPSKWAKRVADARNQVAHALRRTGKLSPEQMLAIERTLAAVVALNLMKQLGFDEQYLTGLAKGAPAFNSARFLQREHLATANPSKRTGI